MRSLIMVVGIFAVTAACKRRECSWIMTFCELCEDNDVELDGLLND
ncbi:MAG: hypothetical protein NC452_09940 [Eubacterium sp.]|nr:hypothetical protein [Eubacterium sp.]